MTQEQMSEDLKEEVFEITKLYGRMNW